MGVKYYQKDGQLWFDYADQVPIPFPERRLLPICLCDVIPREVVADGENTIRSYVQNRIQEATLEAERQAEIIGAKADPLPYPLKANDGQVELTGWIISTKENTLTVRLDHPYQGERGLHFGYASAVFGRFIYDQKSHGTKFTANALGSARQLLVAIYRIEKEKAENAGLITLAEELNS